MRHHVRLELAGIERAARLNEVVDRLLGPDTHREGEVAELQIEVDDRHRLPGLRKRDREVRRGDGLAGSTLRPEHADHRRGAVLAALARCALARKDLLKREVDLLWCLGQPDDVVRSYLEDPAQES